MDSNNKNCSKYTHEKLQDLINNISKCKLEFINGKEECKNLWDKNTKLEAELKETQELEKSHRYHLLTSREMIGNLQETVSQLVYLKRDIKKLKDELISKDAMIAIMEKDKENIKQQQCEAMNDLRNKNNKQIDELISIQDKKVQQIQNDSETQIAECNCIIEELRGKLREMEVEHRDKINIIVLEYEEKIQRSAVQVSQLQEQLDRQSARTEASIDAYRRKLEDLEEKLKQSQFKEYLAQSSYPSQTERVERPYSVNKDYSEIKNDNYSVLGSPKIQTPIANYSNKIQKPKPLQVTYTETKPWNMPKPTEKKGHFNITKKRKLYNEKDFLNN